MKTSHPESLRRELSVTQKRRNKGKYLTWNSIILKFVREDQHPLSKPLDSYRSIKSTSNFVKYNCQKTCRSRRPKNIVKIRKKKAFYLETLTIRAVDLSPTFLNTGTIDEAFQQSEKQDSFRHILKSLVSLHESSGSRFFWNTTGFKYWPQPWWGLTVKPH